MNTTQGNGGNEPSVVPIYTEHGEKKLLFNAVKDEHGRLKYAYMKNGVIRGYSYPDDVIRQIYN